MADRLTDAELDGMEEWARTWDYHDGLALVAEVRQHRADRTLTDDQRTLVDAIREERCTCHPAYKNRDLIDPDCRHEDIEDLLAIIDRITEESPDA